MLKFVNGTAEMIDIINRNEKVFVSSFTHNLFI